MLELEVLTSVENPNLLCISEHWLKSKDIEKVYLNGYNLESYSSRSEHRGGGTAIFARNIDTISTRTQLKTIEKSFEFCTCKFILCSQECMLICVYRSPCGDVDVFLSKLDELLHESCVNDGGHVVVCGDFNVDFAVNSELVNALLQLMLSYGLTPHISEPTRVSATSSTQIDNMFSSFDSEVLNCFVLQSHIGIITGN